MDCVRLYMDTMESNKMFCRLCLNVICNKNFTLIEEIIKEVLGVLLLKLSMEEDTKPVICHDCTTKLFTAFKFKSICMDTEDSIFPYVNSENGAPVDLKEIYLKERGKEHLSSVLEDERICRLCMRINIYGFTSVEDVNIDMFDKYIPEVNFNSTKDPVICILCLDSLNTHGNFLSNCLDRKEQIQSFYDNEENQFHITSEQVNIKSEDGENTATSLRNEESIDCKSEAQEALKSHRFKWENASDLRLYSSMCDYRMRKRNNFVRYGVRHKKLSNVQTYKCATCDYTTASKSSLVSHQLKHKDIHEVKMFKCAICDFKTKYKGNITSHQLKHRDNSEVQMYSCYTCDYKTKHKGRLKMHQLIHRDISEVHMYECATCDFRTKYKKSLMCHELKHKGNSEPKMYSCDTCDYKTNHKKYFLSHSITHKNNSKVQKYKCDKCDFKTFHKRSLSLHLVGHKDISETQMYSCDKCDYKTKHKKYLAGHQLRHKDISEVRMYDCGICDYKSRYKVTLLNHRLRHKNVSEVQMYKCNMCDFKTKYRKSLLCHRLRHERGVVIN